MRRLNLNPAEWPGAPGHAHRWLGLLVVLGVVGCAPVSVAQDIPAAPGTDTALYSLVARAVVAEARIPVRIDPRPLSADPEVDGAADRTRAKVSAAVVAELERVLRGLGIEPTDDATRGECPGALVPHEPNDPRRDKRILCPAKPIALAAIGLPRRGGAFMPGTPTDERAIGEQLGDWAVRVVLTALDQQGAATTVYDFVFRKEVQGWKLVKKVPLLFIE